MTHAGVTAAAVGLLVAMMVALHSQGPVSATASFAITNVTVIDMAGGASRPDMTVIVSGERIEEVGRSTSVRLAEGTQPIDGRGKFLIPGLWDMHVHGLAPGPAAVILPLLVAEGVTGIRQMGDPLRGLDAVRRELSRPDGQLSIAPRVGAWAGTDLIGLIPLGGPSVTVAPLVVSTPEEARTAIDTVLASGASFIKVRDHLSTETYRAILQYAHQRNVPVAGHVPYQIDVRTASDLGQWSIEHLSGVPVACSSNEERLRQELPKLLQQTHGSAAAMDAALMPQVADSYQDSRCVELGRRLAKNGTWIVPTLAVFNPERFDRIAGRADRPLEKYLPAAAIRVWREVVAREPMASAAPEPIARHFQALLAMVASLHKAGVDLLVGTDSPLAQVYPGFSVHEEIALFVKAGMTPAEALRAATLQPARFLALDKELGTVETGKRADLVLLEANPLQDVTNTRRINAVVLNGRLFRKADLADLLAKVEAAANK